MFHTMTRNQGFVSNVKLDSKKIQVKGLKYIRKIMVFIFCGAEKHQHAALCVFNQGVMVDVSKEILQCFSAFFIR